MAVCLALVAQLAVALPAHAAGGLTLEKKVDQPARAAGDEFTYSMQVGCNDEDCVDAALSDQLPPELAGFQILGTTVGPAGAPNSFSYAGCTTAVTADCRLSVAFLRPLTGGGVGIPAGQGYLVSVTLKAPLDLPASWPYNGIPVTNTATATSTTAATVTDSADVTVTIPITVATATGKTWEPGSQQFEPGVASTITVTTQNTSNVPADSLVVQDPKAAPDGATTLDASNPFTLVDFTGFGPVALPAGATSVQVDAYVLNAGSYSWVTGAPASAASIALPAGVTPAAVAGLRYTFRGDAGAMIAAGGAAGSVATTVAQRSVNRQTGASLVGGATLTNTAMGTVTVPGQPNATADAQAAYAIGGLDTNVSAGKSITPGRIPGGTSALATLTGKNDSNGPLDALTISDLNFFTEKLAFGGFPSPISYPTGATGATITWSFSDGTTTTVAVAAGSTPVAPAPPAGAHLTGFSITFTGSIPSAASVDIPFTITPSADFVSQGTSPATVRNTVTVSGTNPAGSDTATDDAGLEIFFPDIALDLNKTLSPSDPVAPGGTVVAQLPTTTRSDSAFVNPTSIVIQDVWGTSNPKNFWNAFDPIAIAPTQVLAGSTLTIEYTTDAGATWLPFAVVDATAGTQVYSADLPGGIEGLRYTFANPTGFAQGTTVSPNAVFQARAELRDGTGPTSVPDAGPTSYTNVATAQGSGSVAGGMPVTSKLVDDSATAKIQTTSGPGSLSASKEWRTPDFSKDLATVSSQSGEVAGTLLNWRVVTTGYTSVTLSDPAVDYSDPSRTVFQAFDLTAIAPRTFVQDPLLRWDAVSSVELYANGAWSTIPAPNGLWMNVDGFSGYRLTPAQVAATTGVRITVVPNDDARRVSIDPLRPPVGSGIATSSGTSSRSFGLVWQLRNILRMPDAGLRFVTGTTVFNQATAGVVRNDLSVAGVRNGVAIGPLIGSDTITLIDQPPAVDVTKKTQRTSIVVPNPGDVDPANYPTNDFTITTRNDSSSRASYLRAIDPIPCSPGNIPACLSGPASWAADPFASAAYVLTNPFERFDLTSLDFTDPSGQIDRAASQVTLWHRSPAGVLSTTRLSVDAADSLPATALADVVGVGVVYQGTSPAQDGGTISSGTTITMVMHTRVRAELRSSPGTFVTAGTVNNYTFAQAYDPVLFPRSTPSDSANATVNLVKGKLGVVAAKTMAPTSLLEAQRANPVTATLRATQGTGAAAATVPTNQVILEDSDAAFWDAFRLTGLAAADVTLPAGADRVRVDVQVGGTATWVTGVPAASAALPASVTDPATITGIRFTFSRADGGLFSRSAVPANFTATAVLRLRLRDVLLSTGGPILFPSTVSDTVTATSHRTDDPEIYVDATGTATAGIALQPGTFRMDVSKTPPGNIHTVAPGESIPWTLTFANTGTGYLTVTQLVDALPASLTWDGLDPVFSTTAGGLLPITPVTTYDPATKQLTFTWPENARRMAPNERFTIVLGLILEPGLTGAQRATNPMTVTTAQTLAACTNTSGNGQGTISGLAPTQCGTTNYVSPVPGPSLVTTKGVKGDVLRGQIVGGVNPTNAKIPCVPDAQGYYRSPCVARTGVGATDEWRINAVNSGTVAYRSLTIVDPLPVRGDRLLATGSSRGSTYRPTFSGAFGLTTTAPAGTTVTWQVTTDPAVCIGTGSGSAWVGDPTCATHPVAAAWSDGATFTDWNAVTGLRVVYTFPTPLAPGGAVSATFRTVNTPVSAADPGLAPVTAPVGSEYAWNQSGATAVPTNGNPISRAPVKAGVTLASGPLSVTKTVSGDAASFAPEAFVFDVSCTVAGTPVQFGAGGTTAELSVPANGTSRIDGIPIGAACRVAEQGEVGEFGETSRDPDGPQTVDITAGAASVDPVPANQAITVDNRYDFGGLDITKVIDSSATVGQLGPFNFTLRCTALLGRVVLDTSFTLPDADGDLTYTVPDDTLPVGTACQFAEVGTDDADQTTIVGDGVIDSGDGTATITIGGDVAVVVTNAYASGTLSVTKAVTGSGAERYGSGPFQVQASCVYTVAEGTGVYRGTVTVVDGDTATFEDADGNAVVLPAGTECTLTESATGGATSPTGFTPADVVTIVGGEPGGDPIDLNVGVENVFDVGQITLTKAIEGTGGLRYGVGPFTVRLECSYDKDGTETPITWGDDPFLDVVLDRGNDYTTTVDDLLVGSTCAVVDEPVSGGAGTIDFGDTVTVPSAGGDPVTIVVTNTFPTGSLVIDKVRQGVAAARFGAGPFVAQVMCTWTVDGVPAPLELPDGGSVTLSAANDYRAEIALLPVGTVCIVVETDAGRATSTTYAPDTGTVVITDGSTSAAIATVTITNDFDASLLASSGLDGSLVWRVTGLGLVLLVTGLLALWLAVSRRRRRA